MYTNNFDIIFPYFPLEQSEDADTQFNAHLAMNVQNENLNPGVYAVQKIFVRGRSL